MSAARRCDRCRIVRDNTDRLPDHWTATVLQCSSISPAVAHVELCPDCTASLSTTLRAWLYEEKR